MKILKNKIKVITKEAKWTSWAELKALSEAGKLGEVLKSGDNIPGDAEKRRGSELRRERVKECEEDCWRLRSPYSGNSSSFCFVFTDGTVNVADANRSFGVAPAFCI